MVNKKKQSYKFAFVYDRSTNYTGGYNYLYNLIYSLSICGISRKNMVILCPKNLPSNKISELSKFAEIKKCSYLTKWEFNWFVNRFFYYAFLLSPYLFFYAKKYKFKFTFFGHFNGRNYLKMKQIYWLPDIQYKILPENFSKEFIYKENKHIKKQFLHANKILVSSLAIKDQVLKKFKLTNNEIKKIEVMHFHSAIIHNTDRDKVLNTISYLNEKYGLSKGYFYCPNQFWAHKNHYKLIKAFANIIKKKKYSNLKLVLTGSRFHKKNDSFFYEEVISLINNLNLTRNIIHFDNLDFDSIKGLYAGCLALVNPSLYEGWSTTIEEARAFNVNLLINF